MKCSKILITSFTHVKEIYTTIIGHRATRTNNAIVKTATYGGKWLTTLVHRIWNFLPEDMKTKADIL